MIRQSALTEFITRLSSASISLCTRALHTPLTTSCPYSVLGLPITASAAEIKTAFKKKAFELHPDVQRGTVSDPVAFVQVVAAYELLSDPRLRNACDRERQQAHTAPASQTPPYASSSHRRRSHSSQEPQAKSSDSGSYAAEAGPTWMSNGVQGLSEHDLLSWRYGLGSWLLQVRQLPGPDAAAPSHEALSSSSLREALGRYRQVMEADLAAALAHAYLGPRIHITEEAPLPKCFEAEQRSSPDSSDDLLQLVSGRTLLGRISTRPPQGWVLPEAPIPTALDNNVYTSTPACQAAMGVPPLGQRKIEDCLVHGAGQPAAGQVLDHMQGAASGQAMGYGQLAKTPTQRLHFRPLQAHPREPGWLGTAWQALKQVPANESLVSKVTSMPDGPAREREVSGLQLLGQYSKLRAAMDAGRFLTVGEQKLLKTLSEQHAAEQWSHVMRQRGTAEAAYPLTQQAQQEQMHLGAGRLKHKWLNRQRNKRETTASTPDNTAVSVHQAASSVSLSVNRLASSGAPEACSATPVYEAAASTPDQRASAAVRLGCAATAAGRTYASLPVRAWPDEGFEGMPGIVPGQQHLNHQRQQQQGQDQHDQHQQYQQQEQSAECSRTGGHGDCYSSDFKHRRQTLDPPSTWPFDMHTPGSATLYLSYNFTPDVPVWAVHEPARQESRWPTHSELLMNSSPSGRIKVYKEGRLMVGVDGDYIYSGTGLLLARIVRGGSVGVHCMHVFDYRRSRMRLLCRATRAQLPDQHHWIFPPRSSSHAQSSWAFECAPQDVHLDPCIYVFITAFATQQFEKQGITPPAAVVGAVEGATALLTPRNRASLLQDWLSGLSWAQWRHWLGYW